MAITLASIKKGKASKPPLAVFYGVAGVGKTELAASWPKPIFLRTKGEDYATGCEPEELGVAESYQDILDAIGVLANNDLEYKTFVLDSTSGIERLVQAEACARNEWKTIEDPGFGKGYVAAMAPWAEIFDGLEYLRAECRMNVVLLGHEKITRFDSPTSDPYSRYKLNLQDRADEFVRAAADLVGFINFRTSLKQVDAGFNKKVAHGEGSGAREIYVEERPGSIAKNRFGMPPRLEYKKGEGWKVLAPYISTAAV